MEKLINKLAWFGEKIDKVCKAVLGVQLTILLVVVLVQVIFRTSRHSIGWATEFVTLLFVWASMLGSAVAGRYMLHIGVDSIRDRLKGKAKKIFMLISQLILIVGLIIFTLSSFDYTIKQAGHVATTMSSVSLAWFYCSLPICGFIMFYYSIVQFLETIFYGDAVKIPLSPDETNE